MKIGFKFAKFATIGAAIATSVASTFAATGDLVSYLTPTMKAIVIEKATGILYIFANLAYTAIDIIYTVVTEPTILVLIAVLGALAYLVMTPAKKLLSVILGKLQGKRGGSKRRGK